ncbi:MAG TPA: 2-oxoglutarate dehydrogenase complex dihydrolipoyllysine-residue succinyltransferase [Anaerolineaceae bacterium]
MNENKPVFFEITVPELGESIVEATIIHWIKRKGDTIEAGEAVVELETSKVNLEVTATQSGTIHQILHQENEDVKVGDVLALIAPKDSINPVPANPLPTQSDTKPATEPQPGKSEGATPVAKRMAKEVGVDLGNIEGTGPGGRVAKSDVINYLSDKSSLPAPVEAKGTPGHIEDNNMQSPTLPVQNVPISTSGNRREERVKLSRRRRTIAESLIKAQQTAAMLTTFNEIDMTRILELRSRRNETLQAKFGIKLGITSFFIKAVIGALKTTPQLNAEIQGNEMVIKHYFDIGIAVANPGGLVVPVVRDADHLSLIEIERRVRELAGKVDDGSLTLEDLKGGTFTITNGGIFGSLLSTPILTYPQVGILGLHKIEKRPVVINDEIVIRPMMYAALTYDHRIVDGQEAVKFMSQIKTLIEDPEAMLLEV